MNASTHTRMSITTEKMATSVTVGRVTWTHATFALESTSGTTSSVPMASVVGATDRLCVASVRKVTLETASSSARSARARRRTMQQSLGWCCSHRCWCTSWCTHS
eukprot:Rmarinus@m.626